MRDVIYRIARGSTLTLGALLMVSCLSANAQEAGELQKCAQLDDAQARLDCYDAVSQRQRAVEPPAPAALTPGPGDSPEPAQPAPLTDAVGEEQLGAKDEKEGPVRGTLNDCREGPTGKWYFYFDNGQVWEQRDNDRVNLGECNFEVTISKDFFGYKMELPDTGNKIRVGRVK